MINLQQTVKDKITELGEEEAAKYFHASKASVKRWMTVGAPVSAVQKVLDDMPPKTGGANSEDAALDVTLSTKPTSVEIPSQPVFGGGPTQPAPKTDIKPMASWMDATDNRLNKLEDFARKMTDPDLRNQGGSGVRPVQPDGTYVMPPPPINDPSPKVSQLMTIPPQRR